MRAIIALKSDGVARKSTSRYAQICQLVHAVASWLG